MSESDSSLPLEQLDAEILLRRVADVVGNAKPIPLSTTVRLENKDEVLELLDEAVKRLPEELKRARLSSSGRRFTASSSSSSTSSLFSRRTVVESGMGFALPTTSATRRSSISASSCSTGRLSSAPCSLIGSP